MGEMDPVAGIGLNRKQGVIIFQWLMGCGKVKVEFGADKLYTVRCLLPNGLKGRKEVSIHFLGVSLHL